ncbi:MAG: hypothetical protein ACLP8B_17285 [Xanthobacteraceae bacterium]
MHMLTNTPELDKLLADLDSQISGKEAQMTGIMNEIVQLKMRKERIAGALREVTGAVIREASPAQNDRVAATGVPGKAAAVIVEALRAAGENGLSGAELNAKVLEAGLSVAAADKAKTRLKHSKMVTLENGRWRQVAPQKKAA